MNNEQIKYMETAIDQLISLARTDKERYEPMRDSIMTLWMEIEDIKREMSGNA